MGLQTPLAPWVLFIAPSLGTLCSVQWMAVSIHFCICQALAEPLRRQLYQTPVSKFLLHLQKCLGLVVVYGVDPQVGQFLGGHSFSLFASVTPSMGILSPLLRRVESIHTLVFLLLELHVVCELYLGYSKLLS